VVAAIGVTAATVRLPERKIPEVAARVRAAAAAASQLLGLCGDLPSL